MILYLLVMILATVVPLLLAVAFLTLVERRVMGAMQRRQGPNAWGLFGALQPFLDGLKLLLKEPILPRSADQGLFLWAPILTFLTSQIGWAALPTSHAGAIRDLHLGTMYVLAAGSLGVYGILLAGWSSNSKYAFLGCCRSVAQMISYELPMGLIVLSACLIANSLNWSSLARAQEEGIFLLPLWPLALIWIICCLAELNRAPFDLPEAEAELVAGYNVEYASMGFALFFIAEYASMILMGTVTRLLFLGGGAAPLMILNWLPWSFWLRLKRTGVVFIYIWVRATLPRFRYDQLMNLGWKRLLPLTLAIFVANAVLVFVFQTLSSFVFSFFFFPSNFFAFFSFANKEKRMFLNAILAPFFGSALAGLGGRWLGARGRGLVTVLALRTSTVESFLIFYEVSSLQSAVTLSLGAWFQAHTLSVQWLLCFDALSASMMVTVCTVSFCVHLYSLGYMQHDPHLPRFLSFLSLFTGSMLVLVTSNDLVTLLVGWEMIGVCSYLLIGFWFHRLSRTKAAQKAMLVNRVSDTILLGALLLSWWCLGSTDTVMITGLRTPACYADWICLCLLGGALGKSAQVGLHIWLADRMEGPTPVSALIHAATLVTAGIFLIARTQRLWECSVYARTLLLWVGAVTSLMRRTLGMVQNDVKRVIAYSTCSQLGYMVVALALSHYGLAMYHLITHACFKRLLFLGAGAVIHACADLQDMRRSGGTHASLPFAWACLLLGTLSLLGWPFLRGYYSKDAILELRWRTPGSSAAFGHLILMTVACLTSAYSFRVLLAIFWKAPEARKSEVRTPGLPLTMRLPLLILAACSVFRGYLLSDALIGWGTPFWATRILNAPATTQSVRSHMIPVSVALLPLGTVFLGLILGMVFMWPLPFCAEKSWKRVYEFLQARWGFDLVFNQQVSLPLLRLGRICWASLDKGVLEVLGPRGVTHQVTSLLIPSVQKIQTGVVHDYALLLQWAVVRGLMLLRSSFPFEMVPSSFTEMGSFFVAKDLTLRVLLRAVLSFFLVNSLHFGVCFLKFPFFPLKNFLFFFL